MRLWEKNIRQVVPYVPGEQSLQDPDICAAGLYPVLPKPSSLPEPADMDFVGVGSDDVLAMS